MEKFTNSLVLNPEKAKVLDVNVSICIWKDLTVKVLDTENTFPSALQCLCLHLIQTPAAGNVRTKFQELLFSFPP